MSLEEIIKLAEEFEKLAQVRPISQPPTPLPGAHAEKAAHDREVREKVREIKLMADAVEKKYTSLRYAGFMANFAILRDLGKAKAYLEDAVKAIEKAS